MKITAAVSTVPVQTTLELPDDTPISQIRDLVIERARFLIANNGAEYVILDASMPALSDSLGYLSDNGFPILVEHVPVEAEMNDVAELAEFGAAGHSGENYD